MNTTLDRSLKRENLTINQPFWANVHPVCSLHPWMFNQFAGHWNNAALSRVESRCSLSKFHIILCDGFAGGDDKAWRAHGSHRCGPHHERRSSRQKRSVQCIFVSTFVRGSADLHHSRIKPSVQRSRDMIRIYPLVWIHQRPPSTCPFPLYKKCMLNDKNTAALCLLSTCFLFRFVFIVSSLVFSSATAKPKANFHMCGQ